MSKRPDNIIWITTDHMRYDCINANGNPYIHTPNLDFLVQNGISFDNCYAQNPLCMPSRSSFMTGFYPQQLGITHNGYCLDADFPYTAPRLLKGAGYSTAQIGKLHFQPHENTDFDPRARHDYGFDVFWLSEEPGPYEDAYVKYLRNEWQEYEHLLRVPRSDSPQRQNEIYGRVIDAPWQASYSGWVAEQSTRYLGMRNNCFLHMGFYAPHPPLNPTVEMFNHYRDSFIPVPEYADHEWQDKPSELSGMLKMCEHLSDDTIMDYRRHFYAMVTGVDMGIGQLFDYLKKAKKLDNTLIVFTSDHGDMCGDHRMLLKQNSFYDQLMHLPLVFHWPDGFGQNSRRISALTEMVDIMPTIMELCGLTPPKHMSGISYAQNLLDVTEIEGRENVFAYCEPGSLMVRDKNYKYIRYENGSEVLYDYADKKYEVVNRATDSEYVHIRNNFIEIALNRMTAASMPAYPRNYRF